jgi:hypothetical protein
VTLRRQEVWSILHSGCGKGIFHEGMTITSGRSPAVGEDTEKMSVNTRVRFDKD